MTEISKSKYYEAVGRRKTATARVRLYETEKQTQSYDINGRSLIGYFPLRKLQEVVRDPLRETDEDLYFHISVKVYGGGRNAQAEAIRHGIARALLNYNEELRKALRQKNLLKRDPRKKERKKFGLKKARKSPQWSKR